MTDSRSPLSALVLVLFFLSVAAPVSSWAQSPVEELTVTARKKEESLQEVPLSITAFSAAQLQELGATNNYDVALLTPNFNTAAQLGRRLDRPVIRGMAAPAVGGEPNASYFIDGAFVSGSISSATLGPVERVEILRGPQSAQFGRATFAGAVNYVTRQPTDNYEGEVHAVTGSNDILQVSAWGSGPVVQDKLAFFASVGLDKFGGEWNNSLKPNQAQTSNLYLSAPTRGDSSPLGETETVDAVLKLLWTPTDTATITAKIGYTEADDGHYAQYILEPGELNCYLPTNGMDNNGTPNDPSDDFPNGTVDNSGEIWYNTSQGAYCGSFNVDEVSYVDVNPFSPTNPLSNPLDRVLDGPANGDPRQARFNLPDFRDGVAARPWPGTDPAQWYTNPTEPGAQRDQLRTLLQYDQGIGEWDLTSRLVYNEDDFDTRYDLDQTEKRPLLGVFHFWERLDVQDQSFEMILNSPVDQRLRGSIGIYYFESDTTSRTHSTPGFSIEGPNFVGLALYSQPVLTDIRNRSVFGSLEFDLTEKLLLSVEARYANDKKNISAPYTCNNPSSPYFGEQTEDSTDEDSITPRFTLNYQATDDVMVYTLAAKGTKPAEFNTGYFRPTANPCQTAAAREEGFTRTEEETAWTYEVGTKTTWFDRRITANLSAFYIDWTNQGTFQTVRVGSVIANVQRNAGRSEVYGLELETAYAITDNLGLSLSYGLANGKYLEYTDPFYANTTGIGLDANGNLINDSNNVGGHQIPNSPKHSIIAGLSYAKQINSEVGWFARTDYVLESKRYVDAANFMTIPNREVWNARLGLDSENWNLAVFVNNILGDETPTAIPNFLYFPDTGVSWDKPDCLQQRCWVESWAATPQRGRNYGIDVLFRFGGAQ